MARDETIFATAMGIRSLAERTTYIDRACGGDNDLRRQVESLLLAHEEAGAFLEASPAAGIVYAATYGMPAYADLPPFPGRGTLPVEDVGTVVGPYMLMERIGEGGMGVVFMAEQVTPIRRSVAVKIIKPGMDSAQVVARFEAERQALALMDHPGIARALDAGTTSAGRPYFAMDLVRGVPITEFCETEQLATPERLQLFLQVCQAVQHAHTKGVIHRDLKPSNVLVALHDGIPVPTVIDFGIAKAVGGRRLTERTIFTQLAQLVGTPLYMSPEQAEFSSVDVDTRSDVYSLGVLLYELLTGTTPFDKERLGRAAFDEVRRIIREEEPPRPSTRLSTMGAGTGTLRVGRKGDPKRLAQLVGRELDWIVMRCLEKDRTRRYETASGLAQDLRRHLADEPVEACPTTLGYRIGKVLRRHRGPVLAAAVVLLALVGGVVGTTWGLVRAESRRVQTERRLQQLRNVTDLVSGMFKALDTNAPERQDQPLRVALGDRLDEMAGRLEGEAVGDPVTAAKLQHALGLSQRHLGFPHRAIALFGQARQTFELELGADDAHTLEAANDLAVSYLHTFQAGKALPLLESVIATQERVDPANERLLKYRGNLGDAYANLNRLAEAIPLLTTTHEQLSAARGDGDVHTLSVKMNLARALRAAGRSEEAVRLSEEAVRTLRERFGSSHRLSFVGIMRLADTYRERREHALALPLYREAADGLTALLGPDSPETLIARADLGWELAETGDPGLAVPVLTDVLRRQELTSGAHDANTIRTMELLGVACQRAGQFDLAVKHLKLGLERASATPGATPLETLTRHHNLACAYRDAKQVDEAVSTFMPAIRTMQEQLGPEHPLTLLCRTELAVTLVSDRRAQEAGPLIAELIKSYEAGGKKAEADKWRKELAGLQSP